MGRDKAFLTLGEKTFIELIVAASLSVFRNVMLIADSPQKFTFLQTPVYPDIHKNCGPLGGIHAALVHSHTSHTFVISCDMPLVTPEVIRFLLAQAQEECVTLVSDGLHSHPLFAVYPVAMRDDVDAALRAGTRSIARFLEGRRTILLDCSRYAPMLRNVNLPHDYDTLRRGE